MVLSKNKFNKKGVGFLELMAVFMIIFYLTVIVFYESPSISSLDYVKVHKQNLEGISILSLEKESSKIYIESILDKLPEIVSKEFSKNSFSNDNNKGCKKNGISIWYDSRTEFFDKKSGNSRCFPFLSENTVSDKITTILKEKLKKDFSIGFENQNYDISVKNDKTNGVILVEVKSEIKKKLDNFGSESSAKFKVSKELEINNFSRLISSLEKIIPKIESSNKKAIPKCLKENLNKEIQNKETFCITENFKSKLFTENPSLKNKYEIKISNIKGNNIVDYFSLKVEIFDKKSSREVLNFGLILKYNIPQNLVTFSLKSDPSADGVLKVIIQKPSVNADKVKGYITLYSYTNFFDPNFEGYSDLVKILESGTVPKNLDKIKFNAKSSTGGINEGVSYNTFPTDSKVKLNLIDLGPKGFLENKKTYEKEIYLFQSYNYESKIFEPLDLDREVFVYVFAYDKNYNYNIAEIEPSLIKSARLRSNFGPMPLFQGELTPIAQNIVSGEIFGEEKSISISIPKNFYNDPKFSGFDIYVLKGKDNAIDQKVYPKCENVEFSCVYFNSKEFGMTTKSLNLILTSSLDFKEKNDIITLRKQDLDLKIGDKYDIMIVPVDSLGRGIIQSENINKLVLANSNADFYYIGDGPGPIFPMIYKNVEVMDKKAPNPITSIEILDNNLKLVGNILSLQWRAIDPNVVSLKANIVKTSIDGTVSDPRLIDINLEDGAIGINSGLISKVEILDIIPVDSSGNFEDISTYTGETYSASFVQT